MSLETMVKGLTAAIRVIDQQDEKIALGETH